MKMAIRLMAVATGLLVTQMALAQAPAPTPSAPPAGSTGLCKDGTYTSAPTKSGACRGHQGVKSWLAADQTTQNKPSAPSASTAAPAAAPMAAPGPAPAPKPAASTTKASTASMAQAPGGGPGMVWVNTESNVYHCPGSQYYGKTKQGSYMSEADAKAKGAHADHNHPCTK
jgi:hypothetical protein